MFPATMPDWTDSVYDMLCGQDISFGNLGITRRTSAQRAAFFKKLRPGCPVNRPINPPATEKGSIRGIDNDVNSLPSNVPLDYSKLIGQLVVE